VIVVSIGAVVLFFAGVLGLAWVGVKLGRALLEQDHGEQIDRLEQRVRVGATVRPQPELSLDLSKPGTQIRVDPVEWEKLMADGERRVLLRSSLAKGGKIYSVPRRPCPECGAPTVCLSWCTYNPPPSAA
jgi:hypothetical protein